MEGEGTLCCAQKFKMEAEYSKQRSQMKMEGEYTLRSAHKYKMAG
jgi:hypothetical protein